MKDKINYNTLNVGDFAALHYWNGLNPTPQPIKIYKHKIGIYSGKYQMTLIKSLTRPLVAYDIDTEPVTLTIPHNLVSLLAIQPKDAAITINCSKLSTKLVLEYKDVFLRSSLHYVINSQTANPPHLPPVLNFSADFKTADAASLWEAEQVINTYGLTEKERLTLLNILDSYDTKQYRIIYAEDGSNKHIQIWFVKDSKITRQMTLSIAQ